MLRETGLVQRKGNAIVDVSTSDWEDGQGVVIMPPDEINALLEEARGEERDIIKNEFREMQRQLAQVDAPFVALLDGRPQGTEVAFWRCGDHYYMKTHLPRTSNTERVCEEASLTEAAQSLLAAAQPAAPCACKSAEWDEVVSSWCWWVPVEAGTAMQRKAPGDPCPDCGEPLPAKPVEAMTDEEHMQAWPIGAYMKWDNPADIAIVYDRGGLAIASAGTVTEAACSATKRFREEAANI